MALRRLTSLEAGRLRAEAGALAKGIAGLTALLADPALVLETVKRESQEVADRHGDERRTAVSAPAFPQDSCVAAAGAAWSAPWRPHALCCAHRLGPRPVPAGTFMPDE